MNSLLEVDVLPVNYSSQTQHDLHHPEEFHSNPK